MKANTDYYMRMLEMLDSRISAIDDFAAEIDDATFAPYRSEDEIQAIREMQDALISASGILSRAYDEFMHTVSELKKLS